VCRFTVHLPSLAVVLLPSGDHPTKCALRFERGAPCNMPVHGVPLPQPQPLREVLLPVTSSSAERRWRRRRAAKECREGVEKAACGQGTQRGGGEGGAAKERREGVDTSCTQTSSGTVSFSAAIRKSCCDGAIRSSCESCRPAFCQTFCNLHRTPNLRSHVKQLQVIGDGGG
jgi:hypothetical protein